MGEITLQVGGRIKMSTVNGSGLRYAIFLAGCPFNCPGCHNIEQQKYDYGKKENVIDLLYDIIKNKNYIDGVTISGGEPLEQAPNLLKLLKVLKIFNINVWMWSGKKMNEIIESYPEIVENVDVIIDGRFEKDNPTKKKYRGSDNQEMWEKIENKWKRIN